MNLAVVVSEEDIVATGISPDLREGVYFDYGDSELMQANVLAKIFDDETDAQEWIDAQVSDIDPDDDAERREIEFKIHST